VLTSVVELNEFQRQAKAILTKAERIEDMAKAFDSIMRWLTETDVFLQGDAIGAITHQTKVPDAREIKATAPGLASARPISPARSG
jgi:hypothetical protein